MLAYRIGISWSALLRGSHCWRSASAVYCTTYVAGALAPSPVTTVSFQPWTRDILRAERMWMLSDSTAWRRVLDSTQWALSTHGWKRVPCDTAATHFVIAEAWIVGGREVRLYAAPHLREHGGGVKRYINVQFVPASAAGCGPRYRLRLLTPAEWVKAAQDWIAKQIDFR